MSEKANGLLFSEKEIEEFNQIAHECDAEPWQISGCGVNDGASKRASVDKAALDLAEMASEVGSRSQVSGVWWRLCQFGKWCVRCPRSM